MRGDYPTGRAPGVVRTLAADPHLYLAIGVRRRRVSRRCILEPEGGSSGAGPSRSGERSVSSKDSPSVACEPNRSEYSDADCSVCAGVSRRRSVAASPDRRVIVEGNFQ